MILHERIIFCILFLHILTYNNLPVAPLTPLAPFGPCEPGFPGKPASPKFKKAIHVYAKIELKQ